MARSSTDAIVLDETDKALIEALQQDGRMPYTRLAERVGLSEAAVRQRVQRLIESGVTQIVAVTDPLMLGFRRMAMVGLSVEGERDDEDPMSTDDAPALPNAGELEALARRHLWMHFSRLGAYEAGARVPIIARGEGCYVWDAHGKRFLDGLSGLFTVQMGHGRRDIAEAAARQAETLEYFPIWTYAHPPAIELAARVVVF